MLIFHLNNNWFNKIKTGEKTHEYRICNDYWKKRICKLQKDIEYRSKVLDITSKYPDKVLICFANGYPSFDNNDKVLYAVVKKISIVNGIYTDLAIDKPVYDIEFRLSRINNEKNTH